MGRKVNPNGFRLGITTEWKSRWFTDDQFVAWVDEDRRIREHITRRLRRAGVSRIEIERTPGRLIVEIHTPRPGMVIGRGGTEIEKLRVLVRGLSGNPSADVRAVEVKDPPLDATLMAQATADQLERRVSVLRAVTRTVQNVRQAGALGVRVQVSGRVGGGEMSRMKTVQEGSVPLHTMRADIDYGFCAAQTQQGTIGVKVWIYKGEVRKGRATDTDRARRDAELATGGTFGSPRRGERKRVSSGRQQPKDDAASLAPVDPDLERLLVEEEALERRARPSPGAPHFRP